jgi:hypothetical protein
MRNGEKLALGLSALAFVVSVASAIFTALQAWTASDTEVRQLRAYVDLTDIEVVCPDCSNLNFKPPSLGSTEVGSNFVHIRFENVGQTAASNITFRINWQDVPGLNAQLPEEFKFPDSLQPPSANLFRSASELGRDKHRDGSGSIDHDIQRFQSADKGVSTLFVYGHVDYCDVFGKPRKTAFCFIYKSGAGEHLPLCYRHNGAAKADHQCHEYVD